MPRSARRTRATACSLSSALLVSLTLGAPAFAAPGDGPAVAVPAAFSHQLASGDADVNIVPDTDRSLDGSRRAGSPAPQGLGSSRASSSTGAAEQQAALPAAELPNVPAGADCPTGTSRLQTLLTESFEKGTLPDPADTAGWQVVRGQARTGTFSARSVISASDTRTHPLGDTPYWSMPIPLVQVPGGKTILRFAIKGTYGEKTAYVGVNAAEGWVEPTAAWGVVTMDVTQALEASDNGWLDVRFANYPDPDRPMPNSTIDIDDVEVYTCTAASNVRGDFDGDGIGDVLTVDRAGILKIWPGTGDLRLRPSRQVGHGWGGMTSLHSPGDLNDDGRADLLARAGNGDLIAYWGDGAGGFSLGTRRVGTSWQTMGSIVPMGDINGDGLTDLLAVDAQGNLRRYWSTGPGAPLTGGTIVGTYFNSFKQLLSLGDYNGDGRWDVVGILPNGDMRVYLTLPTGALYGWGDRIGTSWLFNYVSSPGSFNGDSHPDVLALDASGRLFTYPTLGRGMWGARVQTGTYFDQFRLIL